MLVTTLITLPEEVYRFYQNTATHLSNTSVDQLLSDTLAEFARSHSGSQAEDVPLENSAISRS